MTTQIKPLSATHLLILRAASERPDLLLLPLPSTVRVRGASQRSALESLLAQNLVQEVLADKALSYWGCNTVGEALTLRLTAAGAAAVGSRTPWLPPAETLLPTNKPHTERVIPVAAPAVSPPIEVPAAPAAAPPGGKLGQVLTALRGPYGATLAELVALTGWLPHTTRAALTRLKQRGHAVQLIKAPDRKAYQLAQSAA